MHKSHYVNGDWVIGEQSLLQSFDPSNNQLIWEGTHAGDELIKSTVAFAHNAQKHFRKTSLETRVSYLNRFKSIIESKKQELAIIISQETGKPIWESLTEVSSVINKIPISLESHQKRTVDVTLSTDPHAHTRYKPHGIVVVLGAYNFPAHLSNGHIVPALLAGNCVIYKPSELAPKVAEFIMNCWHQADLPKGVIQCLQGGADTAIGLLKQDIQGVYFTGSFETGVKINQHFANRPDVILALEMGGNNPLIIDSAKDINAAVYQTILSSFITAGQRCSCARRLIIPQNNFGDLFIEKLISASKKILIDTYTANPEPFMGPVISKHAAIQHLMSQDKLISLGGEPLLTMQHIHKESGFLSPGIIDMTGITTPDTEIFAPFVKLYRYQNFEDAVSLANDTQYGLIAGLFSTENEKYQYFYDEIRTGLVNWNRPTTGALSALPFGGIGKSGNHRPSAYFAADYCSYPIATIEYDALNLPHESLPGISL